MKNKLLIWITMLGHLLSFSMTSAHAGVSVDTTEKLQQQMEQYSSLLRGADSARLGVLFQNGPKTYRLDLTIADLMDQVTLDLKNNSDLNEQLESAVKGKPLENFTLWFSKLQEMALNDEDAAKAMNRLIVQAYDQKGHAIAEDTEVKGLFRKISRLRSAGIYGNYLNDPEGEAFSRFFSRKKCAPYLTCLLTVTKSNHFRKALIDERRAFYKDYISMLWTQEQKDALTYKLQTKNIRIIDKSNPKKLESVRIKIKNNKMDDTDNQTKKALVLEKRKTEGWFNAINSRRDKREILKYLQIHLQLEIPAIAIPMADLHGESHILLTPSFLYAHQKIIEPILKTYNYQKLILQGDDEHLTRISKWIKHNFNEIQDTGVVFESARPDREEILIHYEALVSAFPKRPWEPKAVMLNNMGEAVLLVGLPIKALYAIGKGIKQIARIENLAGIGTAIIVTSVTHNPIAGAYSAALVRNSIKVLREGKSIKEAIIPTLIEGTLYAIPAAGFLGGVVSRALFIGGLKGMGHSFMTGQDPIVGTLVGAGLQVVEAALPARFVNLTVSGWDSGSAAANAMIEIAQAAGKGAIHGALTEAISQDGSMSIGDAASKNALIAAGSTAVVIAIFGPRMRPLSVTEAQLKAEKDYQAEFGHNGDYTEDQYLRTPQRWGKFGFRQFFTGGNRGFFYGKGTYIPEGHENEGLTLHEQSHNQQSLERGALSFILDYMVEAFQNGSNGEQTGGGNKFEHYGYLNP